MGASLSSIEHDLQTRFGFPRFLPGQRELIEAVLAGRDAFGLMPTGGGKSLTYQLPALRLEGVTVVISPLIALMKDQVDTFNRRYGPGAMAVAVHSGMSRPEVAEALAHVHGGRASLLYVAPERLEFAGFRERLKAMRPRLVVIDEVHCVSLWGHDFRPSYMRLAGLIEELRPAPVLGLTSTATPRARQDILQRLGLRDPLLFLALLDRPNLYFRVVPCGDERDKQAQLVRIVSRASAAGPQIVYVGRRADAEELAALLGENGLAAAPYHAGMNPDARRKNQDAWLAGRKSVIVATIAFGMGIDNPHVRAVTHYQLPASIESYYQEAGRAGRDREKSECTILYASQDTGLHHYFIRNRYPDRDEVLRLWTSVPARGCDAETLAKLAPGLKPEQVNVAVITLLEQGLITRDEGGLLRRPQAKVRERDLSLDAMYARKDADYRRLEAMESYCLERTCGRANLLRYLGESLPADYRCGNCSVCTGEVRRPAGASARDLAGEPSSPRGGKRPRERSWQEFAVGRKKKRRRQRGRRDHLSDVIAKRVREDELAKRSRGGASRAELVHADAAHLPGPHDPRSGGGRESSGGGQEAASATGPGPFWSSPRRSFMLAELLATQVPRKTGLAILRMVAGQDSQLSPSAAANLLRGAASSDAVKRDPSRAEAPAFGACRGESYETLLQRVLAMLAKGYLQWADEGRKRIAITSRGRQAAAGG